MRAWLLLLLLIPMAAAQPGSPPEPPRAPEAPEPPEKAKEEEKHVVRHERDWSFHITIGAATLAGIFVLYRFVPRLPLLGLFSRLQRKQVLDDPRRQRILGIAEELPGVGFAQLMAETGMARGTLDHHLQRLESEGMLAVLRTGRQAAYYLPGHKDVAGARLAIRSEGAQRLLAIIHDAPGIHVSGLANATSLSPSTVHQHLRRMEAAGVIEQRRAGRRVEAFPTPLANAVR